MTDLVFFYGDVDERVRRPGRANLDRVLMPIGRGSISASLFDLGIYPAAVPAAEGQVWGEVHRMLDPEQALATLDEIEGYSPKAPDTSLYRRVEIPVTFEDGRTVQAWVYFYNAPARPCRAHRLRRLPAALEDQVARLRRPPSCPDRRDEPGDRLPHSSAQLHELQPGLYSHLSRSMSAIRQCATRPLTTTESSPSSRRTS
ncbi:MAG: gamma-glutamylcyclotransferase family protein [Vicinamibacterales bacterium]